MSTPSSVFTEMVTSTERAWSQKVTDNVSDHNALLRRLKDKDKIRTYGGGYEITLPLEYAENGTYQRFAGYDLLNTNASDVLTTAKFDNKMIALHVTASGQELLQNSGKEQMINLVKVRKQNALKTAANQFSIDMYSTGALTNQIGGLGHIVTSDGTGTVGGIVSGTYTFWKNQFKEMTGTNLAGSPSVTNAASMKADMNSLWLALNRGADKPDLIVLSHDLYALYELGEQQLQRYADADLAKAGFMGLKYKSADVIFDDNTNFATNAEVGYFLNTDYLYVMQHKEAQWSADDEKRPTNQYAVLIPYYWMGNLVCSQRALQGKLFDAG